MKVLVFGQLTDITGSDTLEVAEAPDTGRLLEQLKQRFPALETAAFLLAVDQQVIENLTALSPDSVAALLPPFSGG